jgi:hypothetical protein
MGHYHEHDHEHGQEHRGHRGHGHRGRRGFGPWAFGPGFGQGFGPGFGPWAFRGRPGREEWVQRLEEYQKDLEQEAADVADLIRRLKADVPGTEQPTETASA